MKILMLLSLILLVILVAGCTEQLEKPTDNITSNETEVSQQLQQPQLNLTIYIPKTSASVGEIFTGQYIVENKGKVFKAYIVTSCMRDGYEKNCTSKAVKDSFPDEQHEWNRDFKQILKPCEIDENGVSCDQESFVYPGTYLYKLEVYDCSEIENILGVDCNIDVDYDNVKSKVPLLDNAIKTVTVTQMTTENITCASKTCQQLGYTCGSWSDGCGGTINCGSCSAGLNCNANGQCVCTPATCTSLGKECGSWSDGCEGTLHCDSCSQTCEGCTSGKYLCEQISKTCIECITTSNCKQGYYCDNHICVKSVSSCQDLGGVVCDPSTHGGGCCCTEGSISEANDTTCCCNPSSKYSYGACCGIP